MAMKHLRNLLAKAPIPGLLIAFGLYTIALILNGKQKLRRRDEIIMGQAAMDAVINDDAAALSVLARRNLVHVDMEMVLAAAKHARGMEVFEVIRREGWNVRDMLQAPWSERFLTCGFVLRDEGILRWLLARGLDAHKPLRNSRVQLLTFAAFHGASGAVAALLERSVSVVGTRALIAAAISRTGDWKQTIDALLEHGAMLDEQDIEYTIDVSLDLEEQLAELEFQQSLSYNPRTMRGTALHWMAKYGYTDRMDWLLKRGADPDVKNSEGLTARDVWVAFQPWRETCHRTPVHLLAHA